MSIRPIDMQISIQKSDHYIKEFNNNSQINNNQQGLSMETQKQVIENQRQVVSTEATKNNVIDKDSSNKSKCKDNKPKNKKGNKDRDNEAGILLIEDDKGSFVDIII